MKDILCDLSHGMSENSIKHLKHGIPMAQQTFQATTYLVSCIDEGYAFAYTSTCKNHTYPEIERQSIYYAEY